MKRRLASKLLFMSIRLCSEPFEARVIEERRLAVRAAMDAYAMLVHEQVGEETVNAIIVAHRLQVAALAAQQ